MNKWVKNLLLLFEIGGGLFSLGLIAHVLLSVEQAASSVLINLAFALVFIFGIAAGVTLITKPRLGLLLSIIFQAIQIPIITTSAVAYSMFSGATFHAYFGQRGFGTYLFFGGRYYFWLNSGEPWLVGVNFIALFFFICLLKEKFSETVMVQTIEVELPLTEESGLSSQPSWRTS